MPITFQSLAACPRKITSILAVLQNYNNGVSQLIIIYPQENFMIVYQCLHLHNYHYILCTRYSGTLLIYTVKAKQLLNITHFEIPRHNDTNTAKPATVRVNFLLK